MKVLVVTGGIGSGKTSACRFLSGEYGWPVYSADDKVKDLYNVTPGLLDRIEEALGRCFRDKNGILVPSLLADVIFSDKKALGIVESLVFPFLDLDFQIWKSEQHDFPFVILESATILEKPALSHLGDITLLIDAPVNLRLERAADRDGISKETVWERMSNQKLMNEVSESDGGIDVDYLVCNDSTVEEFHLKLRKVVENLLKQKCY